MSKLIAPIGRVIVSIDSESKNKHRFSNGTEIYLGRAFNNLNKRYTQPVNGTVINSQYIPEGSMVLMHHNSFHDTYRIFNYQQTSGTEQADTTKIYSLPESQIFFYKEPGETEWKATKGFATAMRVFVPYSGLIAGIEPKQLKDTLFVTSGIYKNKVVRTVKASDYLIHFQGEDGTEKQLIRFRETNIDDRECEVICILDYMTKQVFDGKLLVGISVTDCKNVYVDKVIDLPKSSLV